MVVTSQANTIAAQASTVQAHLHSQQQQAAAEAQRRSSFFHMQATQAAPPIMHGFFPSMQAAAVAQMNVAPMVGTAKLANSKDSKETNSSLVVRSSVPKFNGAGGLFTVSQWARKCVEDNLEWIVKLCRRHDPQAKAVMLAYGDGCQTLVLLDDAMNQLPPDLNKVQKIGIGVSAAPIDDKSDEKKLAAAGVLQPTDCIWDHLRYEQTDVSKDKVEKIMFIHTCMTNYGDGIVGRRHVLQVKTGAPQKPYLAIAYVPNPVFEQQVLAKWKGPGPVVPNIAAPNMALGPGFLLPAFGADSMMGPPMSAPPMAATKPPEEGETVIMFNPKELILLEKAFDNHLTSRDLKSKADKWSEEDKKACQLVIKRANAEFKWVTKKRRKKNDGTAAKPAAKTDSTAANKAAPKPAEKAIPKHDEEKAAPKPEPKKKTSELGEEKAPSKKSVPKKAEKTKENADKKEAVTKTPVKKSPSSKKNSEAPKGPKSSSKKSGKEDKVPLKVKEEAVDSDDEPISKLKDTPASKTKKTKSPLKSVKSSVKKEVKRDEVSGKKHGRSKGSKSKEQEKPAKKTRSKSNSKT